MKSLAVSATLLAMAGGVQSAAGPPPPGPPCTDCPNIVLMLTDDQDLIIGGWDGMSATKKKIEAEGVSATEFRIHTPICAPSRAELQSGRYYHNIQSAEKTPSPAVSSGAIDQLDLAKVWPYVFPTTLRREKGYVNGMFGKCMNGECGVNKERGYNTKPEMNLHQMGAFDRWFEGTGYYNGDFYDNGADGCEWPWNSSACATRVNKDDPKWHGRGDGYLTSTLGNQTVEWIHSVAGKGRPFFIYFAPHAPHSPATPADWYLTGTWCDTVTSPRLPNWNYSGVMHNGKGCTADPPAPLTWDTDFHELVSCQPYYSQADADATDKLQQARCKTLLSVDDSYAGILQALEDTGVANNTYVLVTSDHGYNLGHHMLPSNKFLLYEHSLRIPMLFAGPGIPRNATIDTLATQVDIAPTVLGLAGIDTPSTMDGRSLVANLVTDGGLLPGSVASHLQRSGGASVERTSSFHEYYSQGDWSQKRPDFRPLDDWSNTYIGLTYKGPLGSWKFGIYQPDGKQNKFDKPWMYELFDLHSDPHELHNVYNATARNDPSLISTLTAETYKWYHCEGKTCA